MFSSSLFSNLLPVIRDVYILLPVLEGQMISKQVLFGMVILACMIAIAMYSVNNVSYATPAGNKLVRVASRRG